ncbi:hypothetical protein OIDMADRAFT_165173 [Oidiodendron maius Zn]|uniref:Mitochondrial intermembrane space import and assembly protein 40 n=1 Tax=Oidiodendron maius (strain Zn) TaxID=913774 RepID=A0A0C3HBF8_OIDMZ|nr:hypothetical protein OIDMADRAFT_165173 [Oidiodendron maius Zn]
MYKPALRVVPRYVLPSRSVLRNSSTSRFLSTAPPAQKRRSWTNSAVRWGLAVGAVYVYSTSTVFAEEPEFVVRRIDDSIQAVQEPDQPTVDAIVQEKRRREAQQAAEEQENVRLSRTELANDEQVQSEDSKEGIDGLTDEADSQGAFNPETGEINWDCPCLGGMAHGPCGEKFKAAFSCFVYSTEEPKGVECIEKFKGMQDCFRLHPEMYGSELEDDEDEIEEELRARENGSSDKSEDEISAPATEPTAPVVQKTPQPREQNVSRTMSSDEQSKQRSITQADDSKQVSRHTQASSEKDDELIPKAAHDATKK